MISLLKKDRIPYLKMLLLGIWPSFIKILFYRLLGFKVGRNVKIGYFSILLSRNIVIEDNVHIAPFSLIRAKSIWIEKYCSIGSFCFIDTPSLKIGSYTRIRESVKVGGNKSIKSELIVGSKCLILQNTVLNTTDSIVLGNDTAIGGGSKLFTHSSWLSILDGYPVMQGPIIIGSNVWLPYDTTVLSNVSIGDNVIITPRTVINISIPKDSIAGGYPLIVKPNFYKRTLKDPQKIKILTLMMKDLGEFISYEGFDVVENEISIILKKMNTQYILSIDYDVIANSVSKYFHLKTIFILFSDNKYEITFPLGKRSSLVYLLNNIPVVINKNKQTSEILTFFSRYGIR